MQTIACLNGELMPADEAKVPIWDRGFLFGDSIYEVLRLYEGRLWLESAHFNRLVRSLNEMWFPPLDLETLKTRIDRTIRVSEIKEGMLYIQITRGVAPRRHIFPPIGTPPTELIIARSYDDSETAQFRRTGFHALSWNDWRWGRCDVKSTNLLANVLACEAAHREGCQEAVLVNEQGYVTEGTHSSLLWVRNGRIEGTPDGPPILPGTSRHFFQELAAGQGLSLTGANITLDELKSCEEVFMTGTTIEVMPVVKIDDIEISHGKPGPITIRLQRAFQAAVREWLETGVDPSASGGSVKATS
jgi:D-alanine transaminase